MPSVVDTNAIQTCGTTPYPLRDNVSPVPLALVPLRHDIYQAILRRDPYTPLSNANTALRACSYVNRVPLANVLSKYDGLLRPTTWSCRIYRGHKGDRKRHAYSELHRSHDILFLLTLWDTTPPFLQAKPSSFAALAESFLATT